MELTEFGKSVSDFVAEYKDIVDPEDGSDPWKEMRDANPEMCDFIDSISGSDGFGYLATKGRDFSEAFEKLFVDSERVIQTVKDFGNLEALFEEELMWEM